MGTGTFINYGCVFSNHSPITIGENCFVGQEVLFTTSTHEIGEETKRAGRHYSLPITVGDGVWIGARAVILPGVSIADGCVIAACAVVNKDCVSNGLYAGVPARRIQGLPASRSAFEARTSRAR